MGWQRKGWVCWGFNRPLPRPGAMPEACSCGETGKSGSCVAAGGLLGSPAPSGEEPKEGRVFGASPAGTWRRRECRAPAREWLSCQGTVWYLVVLRKISIPLSKKLRLQEKVRRKPSPNPILEAFYRKWRKNPQQEEVNGLAKQCDLQPRQVERWFRYRLNQDRPSLTKEFYEASLGTIYYFLSFFMGLVILYNKPWFWDIRECWVGYPKQPLQPSLIGYYLMQFSFYCFLVISLPFDDRQKSTKLFSCLKWRKACDTSFLLFAAVFMFIHLVIFPSKILYNTQYYSMEFCQPFFGYYFFNALLMVLQLLYISWSYLICIMIYKFLIHGTMGKDVRKGSDGSEEEDEMGKTTEQKNSTIDGQTTCQLPG